MSDRKIPGYAMDSQGTITKKPEPPKKEESEEDSVNIDKLRHRGLRSIHGIIRAIETDVGSGHPARETIMNLKDIMAILKDLKAEERDYLDSLDETQLQELSGATKQ